MSSKLEEFMSSNEDINEVRYGKALEFTKKLVVTNDDLKKVMTSMLKQFEIGLAGGKNACIQMLPTFVHDIPSGNETGTFLALDLGGTNFRVLMIKLNGEDVELVPLKFEIDINIKIGKGKYLFDKIVQSINEFMTMHNLANHEPIPLGFTFSFPCKQSDIDKAILLHWTKGFNCPDVVGKNVVKLLQDTIDSTPGPSKGRVKVVALINDTLGTLMSCAHKDKECRVGLIVGTGCNACYMESYDKIKYLKNDKKQMVINTEFGGFGDSGQLEHIRTQWDKEIDENSINKGKQTYEKMISGMYIGEIVRRVLMSLIKEKLLFVGQRAPELLFEKNSFMAKYVSEIDTEHRNDFYFIKKTFKRHFDCKIKDSTDMKIIKMVNSRVSHRAAHLAAVGCATILNRMERSMTAIAYDGTLIRKHPYFLLWMCEKIKQLTNPKFNFRLIESTDGSGRGAAIVAAVAAKRKNVKSKKSSK